MIGRARRVGRLLYKAAEAALTIMLAVMFFAFLFQITARYVFAWPTGWTNELSSVLWLWITLWGASFVVTEQEEMRFDVIYASVRPKARRAMAFVSAVALLVLYITSIPAALSYVTFMEVESSAYLDIRFDWMFSIYIVFLAAVIVRYLWLAWQALRGKAPDDFDPTQAGSGV